MYLALGELHLHLHRIISFDGISSSVNIRHCHHSCSRLSCDSSLRSRRRNFSVSYSLTRVPTSTRQLTCLGGRGTNACMYGGIRNHVSNGFLPGVVWANLSLPESFHTALWSGVLCTVHGRSCVGNSQRRLFVATFGSALSVFDLHHPIQGMPCTVFQRFRTRNSEKRYLAAAFDSAFSVLDVDHPLRCVLCTVLPSYSTCNSERR